MADELSVNMCIHVITQVSLFLAYNPTFVAPFIRSGFLRALEFDMQVRFVPHLRILIACLAQRPASVTVDMITSISRFNAARANWLKLIKLMEVFLAHADEHPEAARIFSLFLDDPKPYLFHEQFIFFVFHAYQICEAVRAVCIATFSKALVAENRAVVRAAIAALCHVEVSVSALPVIELLTFLHSGVLVPEIIEMFASLPALPASRRLLSTLLGVVKHSPLTIICFCKIASDPQGAELFLSGYGWLSDLKLNEAFVLLLTLCLHPAAREVVVQAPELLPFLSKVADQGSIEELDAVVPLLRRLRTDADFIRALDAEVFF
jgi:hypothetical protein